MSLTNREVHEGHEGTTKIFAFFVPSFVNFAYFVAN